MNYPFKHGKNQKIKNSTNFHLVLVKLKSVALANALTIRGYIFWGRLKGFLARFEHTL